MAVMKKTMIKRQMMMVTTNAITMLQLSEMKRLKEMEMTKVTKGSVEGNDLQLVLNLHKKTLDLP